LFIIVIITFSFGKLLYSHFLFWKDVLAFPNNGASTFAKNSYFLVALWASFRHAVKFFVIVHQKIIDVFLKLKTHFLDTIVSTFCFFNVNRFPCVIYRLIIYLMLSPVDSWSKTFGECFIFDFLLRYFVISHVLIQNASTVAIRHDIFWAQILFNY
jgi:hypothetical protein